MIDRINMGLPVGNLGSILLIEDSMELQTLLSFLLEEEGYSVTAASAGQQALDILKSKRLFSLILLDFILEDMDALEFLEKKDKAHLGEATPVVLCSAHDGLDRTKLPQSVVGIIKKPIDLEEFLAKVAKFNSHGEFERA